MAHEREVNDIRSMAYKIYQFDWKAAHHITPEREIKMIKEYLEENRPESFSVATPPDQTFDEFLKEMGYQGELYVCYEEFLENEYQDEGYIQYLFDGMTPEYFEEYKKDLEALRMEMEDERE